MILRRANADDYRTQLCELKVAIAAGEKDPSWAATRSCRAAYSLRHFDAARAAFVAVGVQNFLKDRQ